MVHIREKPIEGHIIKDKLLPQPPDGNQTHNLLIIKSEL